jgi:AraC family transcriptional regulator
MNATADSLAIDFPDLVPRPLASSRTRAWTGIAANVYRMERFEAIAAHREHLVSMQLEDCRSLYQRRNGRESERAVCAREVIITPAGEPKFWRREGAGDVLVISISPAFLGEIFGQASGRSGAPMELIDNFGTRDRVIETLADDIHEELEANRPASHIYVEAIARQLAVHLWRHYSVARKPAKGGCQMPAHKLLLAKRYVEENLGEALSVESIARKVGTSTFHFAHAFRAATGLPPHQYLMQRRMEHAKSLLRETDLSLTEIALRVGYSSSSHFCVAFLHLTRITPGRYRHGP